jgi:hypothetical protein
MENIGNHIESTGEINPADKQPKEMVWQIFMIKDNLPLSDEYFDTEQEAKDEIINLENIDKQNFIFIPYTYEAREVEL